MSIPLVQEATKDAINTSIIAIKRNIERINMLLGLVDSGSPDLSGLATKQELEDAITQVETDLAPVDEVTSGNMHSVTSNAVSKAMSYSTEEQFTGKYWLDGKKIYSKTIIYNHTANSSSNFNVPLGIANNDLITKINYYTSLFSNSNYQFFDKGFWDIINNKDWVLSGFREGIRYTFRIGSNINGYNFSLYINIEYTKATD
jgi:hypothetical protein